MIGFEHYNKPKILVIGIGGGGNNIVKRMSESEIKDVEYFLLNTDAKAIRSSFADYSLAIGDNLTAGRGTGGNTEIGRKAAMADRDLIISIIKGYDMIVIAAGMGGGTGTGCSGIVAEIARKMDILTVVIVTTPFVFEGSLRMKKAIWGIEILKEYSDALIIISNNKLLTQDNETLSFVDAFKRVDDILKNTIRSITDIITNNGLINLDYADFKTILKGGGKAYMSIGFGSIEDNGQSAVKQALNAALLESSVKGATGVIINIVGGCKLSLGAIHEVTRTVSCEIDTDCEIVFGITIDEVMDDQLQVILLATGLNDNGSIQAELDRKDLKFTKKKIGLSGVEYDRTLEIPIILR